MMVRTPACKNPVIALSNNVKVALNLVLAPLVASDLWHPTMTARSGFLKARCYTMFWGQQTLEQIWGEHNHERQPADFVHRAFPNVAIVSGVSKP
jgi:hypothetical protein